MCVIVVVKALDGRILDRPVHPFDLPVGPGMLHLGETMLNAVCFADPVEDVMEGISVTSSIGELNAIVGEHRIDGVGQRRDQIAQKLRCYHLRGSGMKLGKSKLGRSVNSYKEIELPLDGLHFGDVDMEIADRITLEPLFNRLVSPDVGQP